MGARVSSSTVEVQEVILYNDINIHKRSYIRIKGNEDDDNYDH
jgi:hypothetical protein